MILSQRAISAFQQGQLIAYPTEAVFGLGCDPDNEQAVRALLALKQRPIEKGLILVAANLEQLLPYVDWQVLRKAQQQEICASWPGPYTWVIPKQHTVPDWLSGQFSSLAVRVSAHPCVQAMCLAFGKPLVSTSANLTGQPPCRTVEQVQHQLGAQLAWIQEGRCDLTANPTQIRDALTGQVIR